MKSMVWTSSSSILKLLSTFDRLSCRKSLKKKKKLVEVDDNVDRVSLVLEVFPGDESRVENLICSVALALS